MQSYIQKNSAFVFIFALTLGLLLAAGLSVWATSIGNNVSVDGTLTVTGATTANGSVTLGDAAADTLTVNASSTFANNAGINGNFFIGNAATDELTVTATTTVSNGLTVAGSSAFTGSAMLVSGTFDARGSTLTLGDASTDTLDVQASTTLRNTRFGTSGATITQHRSASSTVDFDSTTALSCNRKTVTATGAASTTNQTVLLSLPPDLASISSSTFKAWASAADTVTVEFCLFSGAATTNPGPSNIRIDIWEH